MTPSYLHGVRERIIIKVFAFIQTCVCVNRLFVHEKVHDDFVSALQKAMAAELKVGDGLEAGTKQGPLINEQAVKKVLIVCSHYV